MSTAIRRLTAVNSVLVIVDVQEKLLARMPTATALVRNVSFLLDVATLLEVPVRATEQYPKGLGGTTPEVARRLPASLPTKTAFSCCGAENFLEDLTLMHRPNLVLAGMESHVCILQTALDMLQAGLHVFLPVDALSSRVDIDHSVALRRLEQAGAVLTTSESVAFEWIGDASHAKFKSLSKLVVERGASAV